jgi:histidinol-phosphate aminotransferase
MNLHVNKFIADTERVFSSVDREGKLKLDYNENQDCLPSYFVQSVLSEITPGLLATYPSSDSFITKYSEHIGLPKENLFCTNGSSMAIRHLLEIYGEIGKEVVTVSPTFEMYRINCSLLGYKHKKVEYDNDLKVNPRKILDAITEDTRVVVLVNPNNPIGDVYNDSDVDKIIQKADTVGALVIIDEAYHYFYPKTFKDYVLKYKNVAVLRTFSKLMSLAALRLGVILADKDIIKNVRKSGPTFEVNVMALLFAERLIERTDIIEELIEIYREGKEFVIDDLKLHGYEIKECLGNYILIKTNKDALEVSKRLDEEKNILVHPYKNQLLHGMIRVTTGSVRLMKQFLSALYEIDKD